MDNVIAFLVIATIAVVLAYFKVPKFKELVDTKLFKRPAKPSEPVLATPVYTEPQKPAVEPVAMPESHPYVPPAYVPAGTVASTAVFYRDPSIKEPEVDPALAAAVEAARHAPTKNFYFPPTIVELSETPVTKTFSVPIGFSGVSKVSFADAPSGYNSAARIEAAINGPRGLVAGPYNMQYTGGAFTLCSTDLKLPAHLSVLEPNTDYQVVMRSVGGPTRIVFQVNGTYLK